MVRDGNRGEEVGWWKVKKLSDVNQEIVKWSTCFKSQAESAGTWYAHVISHLDKVDRAWSEIERPQCLRMQLIKLRNTILAVNNEVSIRCMQLLSVRRLFGCDLCQRQQSVNDFQSYTFDNQMAPLDAPSMVNVLVRVTAAKTNATLVAPPWK